MRPTDTQALTEVLAFLESLPQKQDAMPSFADRFKMVWAERDAAVGYLEEAERSPSTPDQSFDDIERLLADATPGPWHISHPEGGITLRNPTEEWQASFVYSEHEDARGDVAYAPFPNNDIQAWRDMRLIAHAPQIIRVLLDHVYRLERPPVGDSLSLAPDEVKWVEAFDE